MNRRGFFAWLGGLLALAVTDPLRLVSGGGRYLYGAPIAFEPSMFEESEILPPKLREGWGTKQGRTITMRRYNQGDLMLKSLHALTLVGSLLLAGCLPTTQMIQDGHYWIQLTQSHNVWGQNVVHVTRCHVDDKANGYCKDTDLRQSEQMELHAGPGPQIVSSAVIGASILGGTALLMHGYMNQPAPVFNASTDVRASTVNPR